MTDAALPLERTGPLPVGPTVRRGLGWWGVLCLIATEGALFGYLLFSYYYFAVQHDQSWFPHPLPSFRLSAPNTVILLLSSVAMWWGDRGVRRGARGQLLTGVSLALLLGIIFAVVQGFEWRNKGFAWRSGGYNSLYFTITGFHLMHIVVGLIVLLTILTWSALGYFSPRRSAPVLIASVYWHFVNAVWLVVFTTFYITPYLW